MALGFSEVDLTSDDDAVTLVMGSLSQESVKSADLGHKRSFLGNHPRAWGGSENV